MKSIVKGLILFLAAHAVCGFRIPNFQRFVNNYKANLLFTSYDPRVKLSMTEMNAFSPISSEMNHPIRQVSQVPVSKSGFPNFFKRLTTSVKFVLRNAGGFVLHGTNGMVSWANFTAETAPPPVPATSPYFPSIYWFSPFNNGTGKAEKMSQECVDKLSPECMQFASKVEKMNKDFAVKAALSGEKPRSFAIGIHKSTSLPTAYSAALNKKPTSKPHTAETGAAGSPFGSRRIEVRTVTKNDKEPAIKTVEAVKSRSAVAAVTATATAVPSSGAEKKTASPRTTPKPSATASTSTSRPAAKQATKKAAAVTTARTTATGGAAAVPAKTRSRGPQSEEDREFSRKVKALMAYKSINGDFKVPGNYVIPVHPSYPKDTHGLQLGLAMRTFGAKSLDQTKKDKLTSVGFL